MRIDRLGTVTTSTQRLTGLSDEDDAKVPRHVPDGWQFELYERPVRTVLTVIEGSRPSVVS